MRWLALLFVFFLLAVCPLRAGIVLESAPAGMSYEEELEIPDPLEPVNRASFSFNDRFYYWFLKPVGKAYSTVVPERVRRSADNFLYNLMTPVRMVNDILQFDFKKFVVEFARFLANTTVGVGGLFDVAKTWGLPRQDEDFGQTLGKWGVGEIAYVDWPVMGPSDVRDTAGTVVDSFFDPLYYVVNFWSYVGIKAFYEFNRFSFNVDMYDDIKQDSLDPYTAVRNMYFQHRRYLVEH